MQVRALLHGQGWYDLRDYRMNPPFGANIHWSRLVDLPIAGLILGLRPFLGGAAAERWAVAIAPMIPYLLLLYSVALTARRLHCSRRLSASLPRPVLRAVEQRDVLAGADRPSRLAARTARAQHHLDRRPEQGRAAGSCSGFRTALSLAIGLEMIIYLAFAGVAMVLFWVEDADERRAAEDLCRVAGRCDRALLPRVRIERQLVRRLRRTFAGVAVRCADRQRAHARSCPTCRRRAGRRGSRLRLGAGIIIAAFHGLTWPQCLSRPEGVSPESIGCGSATSRKRGHSIPHGWRIATLHHDASRSPA